MLRLLAILPLSLLLAECHASSSEAADTKPAAPAAAANATPAAAHPAPVGADPGHAGAGTPLVAAPGDQLAAFAEGCFWGSEDTFRHVPGVVATAVGFSGGRTTNPSYEDVCTHTTGHAETVLVEFDPKKITYADLLRTFWDSHDPTTPNRQGPDIGDQYRSAIFTFSADQADLARASMAREQSQYKQKIPTEIKPIGPFWKAEEYHQQYDERTGRHSCPIPGKRTGTTT